MRGYLEGYRIQVQNIKYTIKNQHVYILSGYSSHTVAASRGWTSIVLGIMAGDWLAPPKQKIFKQKHNVSELVDYATAAHEGFWEGFPKQLDMSLPVIWNVEELVKLAHEVGCEDWNRLWLVCQDIKYGANIGCTGVGRTPTISGNAKSAHTFGKQVTDAIADWIVKGFAAGPFEEHEIPADAKVSGIMCREKPNGSVRIILNLSAPARISVKDGIDSDEFPAVMSSTLKWLAVLEKAGRGCWISKIDFSDAYKQIAVRLEDRPLQYFSWLGKYFVELCLIFGSASSVGIFDRAAKTIVDIVAKKAKFPRDMICQHLDDISAAAPRSSSALQELDTMFAVVAGSVGVRLALRDDPDKSFGPCHKGTVFGVEYDTENWTWAIPDEKMAKIACQIQILLEATEARQDEIQSIVGRIVNVRALVLGGRFHVNYLMELVSVSTVGGTLVTLTTGFKRQLYFWYVMLRSCSGRTAIPAPAAGLPPWSVDCYTDAAGGSLEGPGRGVGVVIPALGWWAYMPWSRRVNSGSWVSGGKKMSRKMAALELVGPLVLLASCTEHLRGLPVKIWVDNSGSCNIWAKGYSNSCAISTTIVAAVAAISASIGCRSEVLKITRCSTPGAAMADALSKADFARFRLSGGAGFNLEPARIPRALLAWAAAPVVDDELGQKILAELAVSVPILGYSVN